MTKKDVVLLSDIKDDIEKIVRNSILLKKQRKSEGIVEPLKNRTFALIFEKPSTRTRISFETAIVELGGHPIYLNPHDMQLGRGETVPDTGKVLSRFVSGIIYRAFDYKNVEALAESSTVPVINALDNREHPCQILADLMTVREKSGKFNGVTMAYVGDGNNVCNSLMVGSALVGMNINVASPEGYEPSNEYIKMARKYARATGAEVKVTNDPLEAVKDADYIYTDVWVSMGEENVKDKEEVFKDYQINMKLVSKAPRDVKVMHCLPAHRGKEITDEVMDSRHSIVFDQAENRLHTEKALLLYLMEA